jgi:hypothetical protein
MSGKVINDNYARLDGPARQARRIYIDAWLRWGFTVLLLQKRAKNGECCCPANSDSRKKNRATYAAAIAEGRVPPCSNPGKHLIGKAARSIAKTVEEIEAHLDDGGSIGLALRMAGVPIAPARLVVFDCDRPGSEAWLHGRTPPSPLSSRGKVGSMHDYQVISGDVPDLKSDTSSLNPNRKNPTSEAKPGIDIKVSGLVVMAFSQNKKLYWNGEDVSADPVAVAAAFGGSLDDFLAKLPHVDPRGVAPLMREHLAPSLVAPIPGASQGTSGALKTNGGAVIPPLSDNRATKQEVQGVLNGVAYNHRKRLAGRFLLRAEPAIEGQNPDGTMFRVVVTMVKHYALSEQDTFILIKKWFNPRCLDDKGVPYPYGGRQLVHMIEGARTATFDPIGLQNKPGCELDIEQMHANHKLRDRRSNERRNQGRNEDRAFEVGCIHDFLMECCVVTGTADVCVRQRALYDACHEWVRTNRWGVTLTDNRIGGVLNQIGISTKRNGHAKTIFRVGIGFEERRAA